MAKQFSKSEWKKIRDELKDKPGEYGFPERVYGSVVTGSFNIRKLGSAGKRNAETWKFLAHVCKHFDLIAVQEVMDDLSGLNLLMEKIGPEFGLIVSDKTGSFPGDRGLGERLAFIFRWSVLKRGEVVSDITYDRSKVSEILFENLDAFTKAKDDYEKSMKRFETGKRKTKPKLKMPMFLSFIRQPFCVSFKIVGHPDTQPYRFMAVNAHLIFGTPDERRKEFEALMEWINRRVKQVKKAYYPNFMLMGDLNLKYDNPEADFKEIEDYLKSFDNEAGEQVHVNFPFLDIHPGQPKHFTSNVKQTQRYDQIGLFFRDKGMPTHLDNEKMGDSEKGPDFGVFNFTELFCKALKGKSYASLSKEEQDDLVAHYEHNVSDHMPLWLRLPLP